MVNEAGATICGGFGVYFGHSSAGTVTNAGDITGFISPGGNLSEAIGVVLATGEWVTNQSTGTISGYQAGVVLSAGGSVANKAGGTISGYKVGVEAKGSATVTNAGDIAGEAGVFAIEARPR